MKIRFVWQGVSDSKVKEHWKDGLFAAMQIVERYHEVVYREPWEELDDADLIMYWEAPCTAVGGNQKHYNRVRELTKPKILLFAGGPIKPEWVSGFDLLCVESRINEEDCDLWGIPHMRAFGVNTSIFKPIETEKKHKAFFQGTFAGWKRQGLLAEALGKDVTLAGKKQDTDMDPYNKSVEYGANILGELEYDQVALEINKSHCVVNPSEYWGGGQRTTLEAMACGIPVVVMSDSPKNREFVEESVGVVCDPDPLSIREAVEKAKDIDGMVGYNYVQSKWTEKHYADNLLKAINKVCPQN